MSMLILRTLVAFTLSVTLGNAAAFAQPGPAIGVPVIYRLGPNATFVRGCFPPCMCPIVFLGNPRGTFTLTPLPPAPASGLRYRIDDVNWLVNTANLEWRITGSGILERAGGPATNAQRLQLDLKINDEPIQRFDSGWVAAARFFPDIDLTVSINGGVCYDTQIRVVAAPVPANQLLRYRAQPGTMFEQGCFPPCLCPPGMPQPLTGTFTLVPIVPAAVPPTGSTEYAVVNVRLTSATPANPRYRGFGFYRRNLPIPGTPGNAGQRMFLDLRSSNALAPERFNSGIVPAPVAFPNIDITMSINGMVCFDKVIHLIAAPIAPTP